MSVQNPVNSASHRNFPAKTLSRELWTCSDDDINVRSFDHEVLTGRIWELRSNLTAFDATYVALAELLDGDLVTSDACLARAPSNNARILLMS